MNKNFTLIALTVLVSLFFSEFSFAQCKIMDGRIMWTNFNGQYNGKLSVYLTDTAGIASEAIQIGSIAGDSDLYKAYYTIGFPGATFPASCMLENSELKTNIGTYSSHPDYYATISILLSNGKKNQISIHSSN